MKQLTQNKNKPLFFRFQIFEYFASKKYDSAFSTNYQISHNFIHTENFTNFSLFNFQTFFQNYDISAVMSELKKFREIKLKVRF